MRKINKALVLLLFLPFLIIFSWFKDGGIHGQGEESLPFYDVSLSSKLYSLVWRNVGAGFYNPIDISRAPLFDILKWFDYLNIPNFIIQAFLDYLLMATGTISVYFLVKKTVSDKLGNLVPAAAGLFYLLNPFSVSQIWGRGLYMQYFPFALFPLFLLLYLIALQKRKILPILLDIMAAFILAPAFSHVAYAVSLWVLVFLFSAFYIYYNRKDVLLTTGFFLLLFIGWILTQGWWLMLYFQSTADAYSSQAGLANENLGTLLGVSRDYTLPSIIRLLHEGYFFRDAKYGDIYKSIPFQAISWLMPAMLLFSVKHLRENRYLKFFGILFIVGLIVSLGANFPFGPIFTWFFTHVPPLQIFRNPFEKFGLILALGYSVLFAVGLAVLGKKTTKLWGMIVMVLILGVYSWPLWTGRAISGIDNKVGIIAPPYYKDLKTWIKNSNQEGYRLIMLPVASGEGVVYQWGDRLYNGVPPSEYLLDYPTISSNPRFIYLYDYLNSLRKYIAQMNVAPAISLLGAKYIVDRQDMVMISQSEAEQKNYLLDTIYPPLKIENIKKVVCQNLTKGQQTENSFWLACEIPPDQANWQDIKYMHVKVKTSVPSYLEIAIRDKNSNRPRWDGRVDSQYSTNSSETELINASIGAPTEYTEKVNMSNIVLVEIIAHPKDEDQVVNSVTLDGIWLDSGKAEKINEYSAVANFGNLTLYQNNKFNAPPHFGVLAEIEKAANFREFFEKADKLRSKVDKTGLMLTEQNTKRDWQKINAASASSSVAVLDSGKINDTKYFIKVNGKEPLYLVLSELFHPGWKVLPDIEKSDLDGSLLNNLRLLKKSTLTDENHFVVNGYANLWTADGVEKYAVVFMPQIIRDAGFTISLDIIIAVSLAAGVYSLRRFLK